MTDELQLAATALGIACLSLGFALAKRRAIIRRRRVVYRHVGALTYRHAIRECENFRTGDTWGYEWCPDPDAVECQRCKPKDP